MTEHHSLSRALDAYFDHDPATLADPYPLFARLRAEDPVHRRESTMTFFILTRYADVLAVLRDQRFSSNRDHGGRVTSYLQHLPAPERACGLSLQRYLSQMVISADPPDHARLRGLVQRALTPRTVDTVRRRTQQLVDDAIDAVMHRGQLDVVGEFADPLSSAVKLELVGVPAEDRVQVQRWSEDIASYLGGMRRIERAHRSMTQLNDYLHGIVEKRRAQPRDDLLSVLVRAEAAGERLNEEELFANALAMVLLGHMGVTNLIGNGVLALLRHPGQLALLRSRPDLIAPAVEELLRYDPPDQATVRVATEDCEIAGARIEGGQAVSLWIGAANRDPARFPEPDRLDIRRQDNRHLSFMAGPHYCLGSALARMEVQVAIGTLLRRLPDLELAADVLQWTDNPPHRGLKALPVTFTCRSAAAG